jgi:chemotaxis protein CheD
MAGSPTIADVFAKRPSGSPTVADVFAKRPSGSPTVADVFAKRPSGSPTVADVFAKRPSGSPSPAALFSQRVIVGVGDLAVSNNINVTLSTYALGSCVGVVTYDPVSRAAGLLHMMLPDSKISPDKAISQPAMFADTGLPALFRAVMGLKGERSRLRVIVAGGASVLCGSDSFKIGERNITATIDWLGRNGFSVRHQITGGTVNRTLHFEVGNGQLALKAPDANLTYSLGG